MKDTGKGIQKLQGKELTLLLQKHIRGGIISARKNRYKNQMKKIISIDATNLYSWAVSESLPENEINFDKNILIEEILKTPNDSDIGYFIETDL